MGLRKRSTAASLHLLQEIARVHILVSATTCTGSVFTAHALCCNFLLEIALLRVRDRITSAVFASCLTFCI